ncbi:hypothetical protein LTR62_001436 [Meristemomyces frigidus]|uniref:Uncharacterized protein n=1 Tax=Meristemomyces frigidus TaxID=1508187 RepID=A0AAN7YHY4_9PEZI|nr:hypothetical protein LTR62_001436 [Meristemomyces frigidus]
MAGIMIPPPGMLSPTIDANCAICNAPPIPECPHEVESLALALDQAVTRWTRLAEIRQWAVDNAKNCVIRTFNQRREARYAKVLAFLETLPCYGIYVRYAGHPPITPQLLGEIQYHIRNANEAFKAGVNEDWRRSCMEYPGILDHFLGLVEVRFPVLEEVAVVAGYPGLGGAGVPEQKRVKTRRDSVNTGDLRKERRRSRGRTPPAGGEGHYRRG